VTVSINQGRNLSVMYAEKQLYVVYDSNEIKFYNTYYILVFIINVLFPSQSSHVLHFLCASGM